VLRLIGFFVLVMIVLQALRFIPILGHLFQIPFFGFWIAAILCSLVISKLASDAVDRRRLKSRERELAAVDTPHNQGKLGLLLLTSGRPQRAIEPLRRAAAGEPGSADWAYRLGCALLAAGRAAEAVPELERAAAADEEHAYGAVQLRLAEALHSTGRSAEALAALDRFERNHGDNPECAYRRGLVLKTLGRKSEALQSLARVGELVRSSARFQRGAARGWAWRALWARVT
jgi:tetratricopeptide (TPR) repeat protein